MKSQTPDFNVFKALNLSLNQDFNGNRIIY